MAFNHGKGDKLSGFYTIYLRICFSPGWGGLVRMSPSTLEMSQVQFLVQLTPHGVVQRDAWLMT